MPDAAFFADKAARCRELVGQAINPEIREQLRLWAEEFEVMAAAFSVQHVVGHRHPLPGPISDQSSDEAAPSELPSKANDQI